MVWKLSDLCLQCIQDNLDRYPEIGSSLPNLFKELLIERLASHDKFYPHNLQHITRSLFCSSLRHINLQGCEQITDDVLKCLGRSNCKLENLKLYALSSVTDAGVQAVVENQDALLVLEIRGLPLITDKFLKYVKCPKLWSFKLSHPSKTLKQPWVSNAALTSFCKNNTSIRELKINTSSASLPVIAKGLNVALEELSLNYQSATDEEIEVLANNCPNLKCLDLAGAKNIGKDSAILLFQACTQMERLTLDYCCRLANPSENEVMWTLPLSLKILSLVGLNLENEDIFVESITRLPKVTSLKLCGVSALNDVTLGKIVEKIGPQLLELKLSGFGLSTVTDAGLSSVVKYCTRLESLHVSLLREVTGTSLIPIFNDLARASRIKSLSVNSKKMEINVLDQMVTSCPNLEFLDISGLTMVTDDLIIALADHAPRLANLSIKGCKMLTDKSICYLCGRCPLKSLVLSGLHCLTDKSIFCIASSCPGLEEVYMNACAQISPVAVQYLQDQCVQRLWTCHAIPNASPNQLMGKNLDTGEFCRLDLM